MTTISGKTRFGPTIGVVLGAALLAAPALGLAQAATETVKGMVVSHDTTHIVVKVGDHNRTVNLTPGTKIQATQGAGVLRRETAPVSDLIRGLAVEMTLAPQGDAWVANSIVFKSSDLKTAKQINAGINQTEGNVAANKSAIAQNQAAIEANKKALAEQEARLNNVGKLVAAGRTKVFFGVGKDDLTNEGKLELQSLAAKAKGMEHGYRLAVVGRADPTGNAAANKALSARRAAAVKTYLVEHCGVLPVNFVPDTALGENPVAQDPDPPKNDSEARRVTVTIMVSGAAKT
jgi:outer membrane protein OmpA-like peptidoglycan-associated protein